MRNVLFTDWQFEQLSADVRRVLFETGYQVEHPRLKALALRAGCRESGDGRVLLEPGHIQALTDLLGRQYPPAPVDARRENWIHPPRPLITGIGNLTPKIFDYQSDRPMGGTMAAFADLVKFAQAEPRVSWITIPLSRQDAPPEVEQLESVYLMSRLTDKRIGGVDATVPDSVPFLAEMGQALGQSPAAFVGSCNCINPPLRLDRRTAETMFQRARYHCQSMITSMPCLGGTGPVDVYGSIVLATAEIVGGLILSMILDPEAPLLGYIASIQLDMRTGGSTSSSPQTVRVDAGVWQLMEWCFGGGTKVGGRSYISARRPGIQAMLERFLKAVGYSALLEERSLGYAGNGNLDNGSMISPEQFLLDLEAMEALNHLFSGPIVPPPGAAPDRIAETISQAGGSFLTAEHTLAHFRDEMWDPAYFQRLASTRTEKEILDRCHADYLARLASYVPASHPAEKVRELERILIAARKHLLPG